MLSGCSVSLLNSYERLPETGIQGSELLPWFQGNHNPILYKTSIGIYKNHYSGLMVIKPVSDTSHRSVLVTEPGIKILDMEFFRNGDFKLHYCLEALNRRSVIRTLQNDFGLMIHNIPDQDKKVKIFEDSERPAGQSSNKSPDWEPPIISGNQVQIVLTA